MILKLERGVCCNSVIGLVAMCLFSFIVRIVDNVIFVIVEIKFVFN